MKTTTALHLGGNLAVTLLLVNVVAGSPQRPQKEPQATQAISLLLKSGQNSVKLGTPIELSVTLTNESGHDIRLGMSLLAPYSIDVFDNRGARGHETLRGAVRSGRVTPDQVIPPSLLMDKGAIITLKPHESRVDPVNVSEFYQFGAPGRYSIQVSRQDPETKSIVKSNTISVTVTP